MKKILAMVLALVMCLTLCACGNPASKLEKKVKEDLYNKLDRDYFVEKVEVTVRKTSNDEEYYYISGKVQMEAWNAIDYKFVTLKTDFEGKYRLDGKSFVQVSLRIDDDWSFVSERR